MALESKGVQSLSTGLGAIDVGDRAYPPSEKHVQDLAKQLSQDGQNTPILVRQVTRDTYKIVCGATRLQAARRLGWERIKAQIVVGLPIDYEIAELSDDVSGKKLTAKQRAAIRQRLNELRRKRAAAAGSVEKAKGGRGKRGGVADAARQAGVSRSTAQRLAEQTCPNGPNGQVFQPTRRASAVQSIYDKCTTCRGTGKCDCSDCAGRGVIRRAA